MPDWTLDSVALIDWYCGRRGIFPYLEEIIAQRSRGFFSTVSELELWQGIRPGEEEKHEAMLSLMERVPLDQAIARRAGLLRQQIGLQKLSLPDAAIAATSELLGCPLLTRNTRDFERLKDIIPIEFYSNLEEPPRSP